MGISPLSFSLAELFMMYEGYDRQNWLYTATLQATQASIAGGKALSASEFHPYMQRKKIDNLQKRMDAASEWNSKNHPKSK